jgi:hypothetical protein
MADNANNTTIWRDAVSAGKDCLSLEVLESVELGSNDPKAQHVAGCPRCQTELAMLRSFEAATPAEDEGAAAAWIAAKLQRAQQAPAAQPKAQLLAWRSFFKVPYMAAAAALIVAIFVGVSMYDRNSGHGQIDGSVGIGNFRSENIRLIGPAGTLSQVPEQFQWEAVNGAANYTVEVMGVDDQVQWSGQTSQNAMAASTEVKTLAATPHKPLKWKVTARDASGKTIAQSSSQRFQVKLK